MPISQSITRLTNNQRANIATLLTDADIPVNNDESLPLGDILPVSRRNIDANLLNNNLRQNLPVNNLANNNLANIPEDNEDLYSGGRRIKKSRKSRKKKSRKRKRRTRKY